jgi:signal transduction histidine kinase
MTALVKNLLDFGRLRKREVAAIDICREIEYALDLVCYQCRSHRITVQRAYQPELPPVSADRQEMRQLFLNLFINACDAMAAGGTLFVRVHTGQSGAEHLCIDVADTGTGIEPDHLPRVMDRFFTTKPEGKGTGLGLSICRRIVREHCGSITIASEFGKGTTVSLKLPVAKDDQPGSGTTSFRIGD